MSDREGAFTEHSLFAGEIPAGFRADVRFGAPLEMHSLADEGGDPMDDGEETPDPLASAYAEGFEAGAADATARLAEEARNSDQARAKLVLSLSRLDNRLEEELRQRLRDTVVALCEAAIAPLALDEALLVRRIERAASMLARADDDRVIRLHPEDMAFVAPRLGGQWQLEPDPALERGALRIESLTGGVEDGPATWRQAIAEAMRRC